MGSCFQQQLLNSCLQVFYIIVLSISEIKQDDRRIELNDLSVLNDNIKRDKEVKNEKSPDNGC
ncbi:MAG: hypothetical protein JXB88_21790 [Spirochaetales bacterium]|nr:hypothetical protein [Spirochaetales bacterium]